MWDDYFFQMPEFLNYFIYFIDLNIYKFTLEQCSTGIFVTIINRILLFAQSPEFLPPRYDYSL